MSILAASRRPYPVSSSSRRRRFLAAQQYLAADPSADVTPPAGAPDDAPALQSPLPDRVSADEIADNRRPTGRAPDAAAVVGSLSGSAKARLQQRLASPAPLIWMIAGDGFAASPADSPGRSLSVRLAEAVREESHRRDDVVILCARPGQSLPQLVEELSERAWRFQPDVVLLSLSTNHAAAGQGGLEAFERRLAKLVQMLLDAGSLPVLYLPPDDATARRASADAADDVDQYIYAAAIRATAAEYDVPMVDHAGTWDSGQTTILCRHEDRGAPDVAEQCGIGAPHRKPFVPADALVSES